MRVKLLVILVGSLMIFGCTPVEKLKYTVESPDSKDKYYNNRSEKTIQPYDYLYIKIYSLDETTASIFDSESRTGHTNVQLVSYEVSDEGYINFPFIGNIYIRDLTIEEAREKLEKELGKYLTNISVRVRYVGNKISVIGEVKNPGNYTFYDEKISVFQALGLAGDIYTYGDKSNVTLIRELDDNIYYYDLDLTSKNIAESEYYYMLPNDILIVNPVDAKFRNLQDRNLLFLIFSGLTSVGTFAIAISQITR